MVPFLDEMLLSVKGEYEGDAPLRNEGKYLTIWRLVNFCNVEVSFCAFILSTITYEPIPIKENVKCALQIVIWHNILR